MSVVSVKSDLRVLVNGTPVPSLISVKTDYITAEKSAYEFLSDEAWAVIASLKKYLITLTFSGEHPVFVESTSCLSLEKENRTVTYSDCSIKSIEQYYSDGKYKTKVEITAGKKE
jgi:hypothetical protein